MALPGLVARIAIVSGFGYAVVRLTSLVLPDPSSLSFSTIYHILTDEYVPPRAGDLEAEVCRPKYKA